MKNSILYILLSATIFLVGCESNMTERSIGFVTGENSDTKWHLGTQDAIDIVSTVDKLWANQDYDGMRPYFADSVEVIRPNGSSTNTFDDFVDAISSGASVTWSYNYAFSVDLDPTIGGEHVQAGFSVDYPATENSEEYTTLHHESYYVVDGKIITLRQYAIRGGSEE